MYSPALNRVEELVLQEMREIRALARRVQLLEQAVLELAEAAGGQPLTAQLATADDAHINTAYSPPDD